MEHWGPLLQALLWVLLVGGVVARFNKPIESLLTAIGDRIKSGSDLKIGVGGFQLSASSSAQQAAKANEEAAEAREALVSVPAAEESTSSSSPPTTSLESVFRTRYFLAEDLAMRAIQSEYAVPINRQVTGGNDHGFDGAFVKDGSLTIVEVKYSSMRFALQTARVSLRKIEQVLHRYHWQKVKIVFVVVIDDPNEVQEVTQSLSPVPNDVNVPVDIRVYALPDLQAKFGLSDGAV